jgi:hypothetical protein
MTLAIGARLHPVAAQARHAPASCRRFRTIKEYPPAFFRCTHLQPVQGSIDGTIIEFRDDRRQARQGIISRRPQHHAAIVARFHDKRKQPPCAVQRPGGFLVFAPLSGIMQQIVANAFAQVQRCLEHRGRDPGTGEQQPALRHPRAKLARPSEFIALRMLYAVMDEMPDIERIGEIVEIGQWVWNLELSGLFGHWTPVKHIYRLTAIETGIVIIVVFGWRLTAAGSQTPDR